MFGYIYIGISLMFVGLIDVKDYFKNYIELCKEYLGKVLVGVFFVIVYMYKRWLYYDLLCIFFLYEIILIYLYVY